MLVKVTETCLQGVSDVTLTPGSSMGSGRCGVCNWVLETLSGSLSGRMGIFKKKMYFAFHKWVLHKTLPGTVAVTIKESHWKIIWKFWIVCHSLTEQGWPSSVPTSNLRTGITLYLDLACYCSVCVARVRDATYVHVEGIEAMRTNYGGLAGQWAPESLLSLPQILYALNGTEMWIMCHHT